MHPEREYMPFLEEIFISDPRIQIVIYTDITGIPKCAIKRDTKATVIPTIDLDYLFLGCAIAQSYMQFGSYYEYINLRTVIISYQHGTLLFTPVQDLGMLLVLAKIDAHLGNIRFKMTVAVKKLLKLEVELESRHVPSLAKNPGEFGTNQHETTMVGAENPPIEKEESVDDIEKFNQDLEL